MGVDGSLGYGAQEIGLAHMVGACAGHEDAAGSQHFESAKVKLLVPAERGLKVLA